VTAEAAVALPALTVVLAAALWGIGAAGLQARCAAAARAAALAGARNESAADISAHVHAAVGPTSSVSLLREGNAVLARVSSRQRGFGPLPSWSISADATAELEPAGGSP
jgi:hypothetical protein